MVLNGQTELSGQSVIKFNRNHPETSFLSLQVLSWGPFMGILEGVEVKLDAKLDDFA